MSAYFSLSIKLGNTKMMDGFHVGEALEDVAEKIRGIYDMPKHIKEGGELYGAVFGINGNEVGRWEVAERNDTGPLSEQIYDALMAHGRRGLADAYTERPSAESIADAVLDSHVIQPHWIRNREQVRDLITEAIQRDRGEI